MKALETFNRGDLDGAIQLGLEQVKNNPKDSGARETLAELLCFRGQYERADKQLETLLLQDPASTLVASLVRQLIRGEVARKEFWTAGRVPEFLGEPDECLRQQMQAILAWRNGESAQAGEHLAAAEEARLKLAGSCNDAKFTDFRDLDDLNNGLFEVLTSTGKYYWVPASRVVSMQFEPPQRPRDLLWRQCQMEVESGPHGVVYLPTTYIGSLDPAVDGEFAMGRSTDWLEEAAGWVRGRGQRVFAVDDADVSIMELETVAFEQVP